MAVREKQKVSTFNLLGREVSPANPMASTAGGRQVQNFLPRRNGFLERKTASQRFVNESVASAVRRIIYFPYQDRAGEDHAEYLWVKADGRIYHKSQGGETEVYPASETGGRVLDNPEDVAYVVANNKLFLSDGDQRLVYIGQRAEGDSWFVWGMSRPDKPVVEVLTGSSLNLSTGRKYAVTWVHIVDGVRIHESSRSARAEPGAVSGEFFRVHQPPNAPSRATHWSIYTSTVDGASALFRAATVLIATTTYDDDAPDFGTAGSTMVSIRAPERNDEPPESTVLELHRNRIFARNEDEPNELWFSALGEVRGLGNGGAEESFPGFAINTISDLQNFFDTPDQTSQIAAGKSWANQFWFFTRRKGFRLTGQGGLQGNFPLQDFFPRPAFSVGCAGSKTITDTPFGLAWMSPERRMWLFAGGGFAQEFTAALLDIGQDKQSLFNQIDDTELRRSTLVYYAPLNSLVYRFQTYDGTNRLYLFSFDMPDPNGRVVGGWYEISDLDPTAVEVVFDTNKDLLVVGEADGELRLVEQVVGNTVIGKSQALIGKIVLGASTNIANYPAATLRTSNTNLGFDGAKWAVYAQVTPHRQAVADDRVNTTTGQAAPTVAFWDDVLDPENPGSSTSVTLSAVTKTRHFRGNIGGAGATYLDRLMLESQFASGSPEGTADVDDFLECYTSRINGLAIAWRPEEEKFPNP